MRNIFDHNVGISKRDTVPIHRMHWRLDLWGLWMNFQWAVVALCSFDFASLLFGEEICIYPP